MANEQRAVGSAHRAAATGVGWRAAGIKDVVFDPWGAVGSVGVKPVRGPRGRAPRA